MKTLIIRLTLLISMATVPAHAGVNPTWDELNYLIGKMITSEDVKQFVEAHNLSKSAKGDSGSFTPNNNSYSVMFDGDRVSTIILNVAPWPNNFGDAYWKSFDGDLPAKIQRDHIKPDFIKMFGESHTPQGDAWITDGLEIWVHFNKEGAISSLYVSQASATNNINSKHIKSQDAEHAPPEGRGEAPRP